MGLGSSFIVLAMAWNAFRGVQNTEMKITNKANANVR